ncbi:MAG: amino acid adenylation domain-containing protein, partial [Bacteroidota bacterium]
LIFKAAAENPDAIAVVGQHGQISYRQLIVAASRLAKELKQKELKPGERVGLYMDRGPRLFAGMLGILAAGGAYVPMDPQYPNGRLSFIAEDADLTIIVVDADVPLHDFHSNYDTLEVSDAVFGQGDVEAEVSVFADVQPENAAYLIYTSGSTGQPKGVLINHENLLNSTSARFEFYDHQPKSFLLLSSFSFDSSVAGIFWTLSRGGKLVVPQGGIEQDILELGGWFEAHSITHSLMLPSLYQLVLDFVPTKQLDHLACIAVAGEACTPHLVGKHFEVLPEVQLINEYGPTEGTVWSTAHKLTINDINRSMVPIGRPIPNMRNYVLSSTLSPLPVGVIGELFIGGRGISSGYWRRSDLTQTRFLSDPFTDDSKAMLYRTGDLARYRDDGCIEFLGRADHQIKIRGHRVEPQELATAITSYTSVKEAVVRVVDLGAGPELAAYVVADTGGAGFDQKPLRAFLRNKLPNYMQPKQILIVGELPRLPNGKLDMLSLPDPVAANAARAEGRLPASETELILSSIWSGVLGVSKILAEDDFFGLGGDSLKSIRLIAQAKKHGLEITPSLLFRHSALEDLARALDDQAINNESKHAKAWYDPIVALKKEGNRPPLFCFHSGGGHVFFYRPLAERLLAERPLYAIQPPGLDGAPQPFASIEEMTAFYLQEIKKVQAKGPYHILGTCFSNAVCLELTKRLEQAG